MFLELRNSMYSVIPWNSANPISWCRLLGCRPKEKAVNQMLVHLINGFAKLDGACSDEVRSSNVKSVPLLGSHLSTPLVFNPGFLDVANKLAASLSEATTCGGFGSGLLLHHGGFVTGLLHLTFSSDSLLPALQSSIVHERFIMFGRCAVSRVVRVTLAQGQC